MKYKVLFVLLFFSSIHFSIATNSAFGSVHVYLQDNYAVQGEVFRIVCLSADKKYNADSSFELQVKKITNTAKTLSLTLKAINLYREKAYSIDIFYIPIPVLSIPDLYSFEIIDSNTKALLWSADLPLIKRNFPLDLISLGKSMTNLRTVIDKEKQAEALELKKILNSFENEIIISMPNWQLPQYLSRRTGAFGDHREWRYSDGSSAFSLHYGMDYGGGGREVKNAGYGWLELAKARIVTGNSIVLRHLPGVFSLYYHLSEILPKTPRAVIDGQPIGQSGATGLVTGPHLHWELRIQGQSADPESLLRSKNLDKEAFLGIIGIPFEP